MNDAARSELIAELERFEARVHGEAAARIRRFVEADPRWWERSNSRGHVTASAWIVSADRLAALLVHHRKLNRWLQPGGHIESDTSVHAAAFREAREESGLASLRPCDRGIFDLDIHLIPARDDFPAHEHLDVRFLFEADSAEIPNCSSESHAVRWWPLYELSTSLTDESVLRMVRETGERRWC